MDGSDRPDGVAEATGHVAAGGVARGVFGVAVGIVLGLFARVVLGPGSKGRVAKARDAQDRG